VEIEDEVINFLVNDFLDFLRGKEMSMERVSWEYIKGVSALQNYMNMLGIAIGEALPNEGVRRSSGWTWQGFSFNESDLWVGIRFRNPLILSFENNGGNDPTFKKDLNLEDIHFFSLDAGKQLEELISFISENYQKV